MLFFKKQRVVNIAEESDTCKMNLVYAGIKKLIWAWFIDNNNVENYSIAVVGKDDVIGIIDIGANNDKYCVHYENGKAIEVDKKIVVEVYWLSFPVNMGYSDMLKEYRK